MKRLFSYVRFIGPWLLVFCQGCGPADPVRVPVSGTVTWQGQPVVQGDIVFEADGELPAADAGKIVNGEYTLKATLGPKKVRIHASREDEVEDPVMKAKVRKPYIPPEYNATTKLSAEVKAGTENKFDFTLPQP